MTDAACQRYSEGQTPQSRMASASPSRPIIRCSRAIGTRLLYFAAASLSLPGTSPATERTRQSRRRQVGIYREASAHLDSAGPDLRYKEKTVHQRGGQPGVARAAAARARAWVSRGNSGNMRFVWNIVLIVCCRINWLRYTSFWSQTAGSRSEKAIGNQQIQPPR